MLEINKYNRSHSGGIQISKCSLSGCSVLGPGESRKRHLLPSIEFIYQIILNACVDFHMLRKYLLRTYSVSWTALGIGYMV